MLVEPILGSEGARVPTPHHARPFVGVFQWSSLDRFVNFWQLFPAKWLQNRPQITKPSPGIPPRRAFGGQERRRRWCLSTLPRTNRAQQGALQGYLAHTKLFPPRALQ